jgi:hypothetical protein
MSNIQHCLLEVTGAVERLRTTLSEGQPADISALRPYLDNLNTCLAGLDKETGKAHLHELEDLNQALKELSTDFLRQKESAQAALENINIRLKAGTAYARSAAAVKTTTEDN